MLGCANTTHMCALTHTHTHTYAHTHTNTTQTHTHIYITHTSALLSYVSSFHSYTILLASLSNLSEHQSTLKTRPSIIL